MRVTNVVSLITSRIEPPQALDRETQLLHRLLGLVDEIVSVEIRRELAGDDEQIRAGQRHARHVAIRADWRSHRPKG